MPSTLKEYNKSLISMNEFLNGVISFDFSIILKQQIQLQDLL